MGICKALPDRFRAGKSLDNVAGSHDTQDLGQPGYPFVAYD